MVFVVASLLLEGYDRICLIIKAANKSMLVRLIVAE